MSGIPSSPVTREAIGCGLDLIGVDDMGLSPIYLPVSDLAERIKAEMGSRLPEPDSSFISFVAADEAIHMILELRTLGQ